MKAVALEFLMTEHWAINNNIMRRMLDIAARGVDGLSVAGLAEFVGPVGAVEQRAGERVSHKLQLRDNGVAVLSVVGVISRYASMFEDACGGVSVESLAKEIEAAYQSPAIQKLAIVFDTPGGTVNGIHELGEIIHGYRGRFEISAYVGHQCASAGYWLAAACQRIVIDSTASVGSVGTIAGLEWDEAPDKKRVKFVSSQSPLKGLEPDSEDFASEIQSELDDLADIFISRLATYRDVPRADVLEKFGRGGVLIGQRAIDAGMADEIGSLESLIKQLAATTPQRKTSVMAKEQSPEVAALVSAVSAVSAAEVSAVMAGQSDEFKQSVVASLMPAPVMALDKAGEVAKACMDAGLPELSASLLTDTTTYAAAESQITQAKGLKSALGSYQLEGSFSALLPKLSDPVALLSSALHEHGAQSDRSDKINQEVTGETVASAAHTGGIVAADIYKQRAAPVSR